MSNVSVQPGRTRPTDFQIQLAPSPNACTAAHSVTPRCRRDGPQVLRSTFDAAIIANDTTTVASGRRSSCQRSGVTGSPASRFEITVIFRSFQPDSRVLTLPASTANSTAPFARPNTWAVTASFG